MDKNLIISPEEPMEPTTPEGQYLLALIKKHTGRIEALEKRTAQNSRGIRDIEEEYPLLPPEADDLSNAVRQKGAQVMGGKKSEAYADKEIRQKVYRDIYTEIKRQYGLINADGRQQSYKKLKRKYLSGALNVVGCYEPPVSLANEIDAVNELEDCL